MPIYTPRWRLDAGEDREKEMDWDKNRWVWDMDIWFHAYSLVWYTMG
jgi:hypothetical protein